MTGSSFWSRGLPSTLLRSMYSTANQCPSGGRGSASNSGSDIVAGPCCEKNDQNLTPLLHSSLQPFLYLLVTTLSSAFDSDRAPERRGGKNKVFLHMLLCRQPLSPHYRILIRIYKPQIPLLNLYNTKNLYENGPNPFFFFGTKNMSEGHLMHTVLVCYFFDKLGQACLRG